MIHKFVAELSDFAFHGVTLTVEVALTVEFSPYSLAQFHGANAGPAEGGIEEVVGRVLMAYRPDGRPLAAKGLAAGQKECNERLGFNSQFQEDVDAICWAELEC